VGFHVHRADARRHAVRGLTRFPAAALPAIIAGMATQRLGADIRVGGFGMLLDGASKRLDFPRGEIDTLRGQAGPVAYGAKEIVLDGLYTLLGRTHWAADAGSAGGLFLRADDGSIELDVDRIEVTRGVQITRAAEGGVELIASHASLNDAKLIIPDLSKLRGKRATEVAADVIRKAADVPLRQEKLRFLDTLSGEISLTIKVVLDLPVVGTRTLDQALKIPIKAGALDYAALERSLDWLEGTFLDLGVKNDRLVLSWGVPILVKDRELVSFTLGDDAKTLAAFQRVPLRALADFRVPGGGSGGDASAPPKKKSALRALKIHDLKVSLSMAAPQSVEIGGGAILFGGEDAPGILGLEIGGDLVHPPTPEAGGNGRMRGALGLLDVTAKDLKLGPMTVTCDRLHLAAIESIDVAFDGFKPTGLTASIHRITATNLSLRLA
jgi:hypothetical protein